MVIFIIHLRIEFVNVLFQLFMGLSNGEGNSVGTDVPDGPYNIFHPPMPKAAHTDGFCYIILLITAWLQSQQVRIL